LTLTFARSGDVVTSAEVIEPATVGDHGH